MEKLNRGNQKTTEEDEKPIDILKCKVTENPEVLDINSGPTYVLQPSEGSCKSNQIDLQPIKQESKSDEVETQSAPECIQTDNIPTMEVKEIKIESMESTDVILKSFDFKCCEIKKEIPCQPVPKKPDLESFIRPPAAGIQPWEKKCSPINLEANTKVIARLNKIKFQLIKKSEKEDDKANPMTKAKDDLTISKYTDGRKKIAEANNVQEVVSKDNMTISNYAQERKKITEASNVGEVTSKDDRTISKYTQGRERVIETNHVEEVIPKDSSTISNYAQERKKVFEAKNVEEVVAKDNKTISKYTQEIMKVIEANHVEEVVSKDKVDISKYAQERKKVTKADNVEEVIFIGKDKKVDVIINCEVKQKKAIADQGTKSPVNRPRDTPTQTSRLAERCSCSAKDVSRTTRRVKRKSTLQRDLSDTTAATPVRKQLSPAEFETIKNVIRSYQDKCNTLHTTINSLESEVKKGKQTIYRLQKELGDAREMTKGKAFKVFTSGMKDDAKVMMKMQLEQLNKSGHARRFNFKEKFFALTLYKCGKKAYDYLSTIFALPTTTTLDRFMNELCDQLVIPERADRSNSDDGSQATEVKKPHNLKGIGKCSMGTKDELEEYSDQIDNSVGYLDYSDKGSQVSINNDSDVESSETYITDNEASEELLQPPSNSCDAVGTVTNDWNNVSRSPDTLKETILKGLFNDNHNFTKVEESESLNAIGNKCSKEKVPKPSAVKKKNKIDSILSRMMTTEELKNLVDISELQRRVGVRRSKSRPKGTRLHSSETFQQIINLKIDQKRVYRKDRGYDDCANQFGSDSFSNGKVVQQKNVLIIGSEKSAQRKRKGDLETHRSYTKTKLPKIHANTDFLMLDAHKTHSVPSKKMPDRRKSDINIADDKDPDASKTLYVFDK